MKIVTFIHKSLGKGRAKELYSVQCFQIRRICAKMAHLDPLVAHLFCQFARSAKSEKYGAFRVFSENYY